MKNSKKLVLAISVALIVTACTKSTETTTSPSTPTVQPKIEQTPESPAANPAPARVEKKNDKSVVSPAPARKQRSVNPQSATSAVPSPAVKPAQRAPAVVPPATPTVKEVTIPTGTVIPIRTIESIDSRTDQAGQLFRASLDEAITIDNEVVIPKSAHAELKLVHVASAGSVRGQSELQVELDRVVIGSRSYTVKSDVVERIGSAEGPKTARDTAIGAAIGAVIGAIAGGGKGAAIGAGTGAGAGIAIGAITKGEQVLVPSETRLDFRLVQPLAIDVDVEPISSSNFSNPLAGPVRLGEDSAPPTVPVDFKVSTLTGEWTLNIEGPRGIRILSMSLTQDGRTLTGTLDDPNRGAVGLSGTVDGDTLSFSTESDVRGFTVTSDYSGTIVGRRLQGSVTVRVIGPAPRPGLGRPRAGSRTFNWTATRLEL